MHDVGRTRENCVNHESDVTFILKRKKKQANKTKQNIKKSRAFERSLDLG